MSTGRSEAKRQRKQASELAAESNREKQSLEERAKRERERSQKMFIRQVMARQGGGFFDSSQTLG